MASVHLTIPGLPLSKNRALRAGVNRKTGRMMTYRTAESRQYEAAAGLVAKAAMRGRKPLEGLLRVQVQVVAPNRVRLPDCDNCAKAPLDLMRGIVYGDDRQIDDLRVVRWVQRGADPRVEIEVEQIAEKGGVSA